MQGWVANTGSSALKAKLRKVAGLLGVEDWLHFIPLPMLLLSPRRSFMLPTLLLALLASFCCLAFSYMHRNVVRAGGLEKAAARCRVKPASLKWLIAGWEAAAIGSAVAISTWAVASVYVSMLAAFLYTAGPRLKRVPVLGSLVQLAIYLPLMVIGMYRELNVMQIEIMAIFSILLLQNQLLRECSERDSDKTDGNVTTVVRFGVGFAEISTAVMGSAASVLLLVLGSSKMKYEILAVGIVLLSFTLYSLAGRGMNEVYSARMLWIVHRFVAVVIGAVVWFNYLL